MAENMKDKPHEAGVISADMLEFASRLIEHSLKELGVKVAVVAAYPGPLVTRYEIKPALGVSVCQIVKLIEGLEQALSVDDIRVVDAVSGKTNIGLELPNPKR